MTLRRLPDWLKKPLPQGQNVHAIAKEMRSKGLVTVCTEARCPNLGECWSQKTATIMILGDTCTRGCKFCNVKTGNPQQYINESEIEEASDFAAKAELRYIVITSVDRDDLPDHGATHFANVIKAIHNKNAEIKVEVLVPDFGAIEENMKILAGASPFVIAHNLETIRRLTPQVRDPRSTYEKSLNVLSYYKKNFPKTATKSSLMLGLGESTDEILETMDDLLSIGVNILTLGQYLQPSSKQLEVQKFYHPDEFIELKKIALQKGFEFVASGPHVRSSYKAADYFHYLLSKES